MKQELKIKELLEKRQSRVKKIHSILTLDLELEKKMEWIQQEMHTIQIFEEICSDYNISDDIKDQFLKDNIEINQLLQKLQLKNVYDPLSDEELKYIEYRKKKDQYEMMMEMDITLLLNEACYKKLSHKQKEDFLFNYFMNPQKDWYSALFSLFSPADLMVNQAEIVQQFVKQFDKDEDFYQSYIDLYLSWCKENGKEDELLEKLKEKALVSPGNLKDVFLTIYQCEDYRFEKWLEKKLQYEELKND